MRSKSLSVLNLSRCEKPKKGWDPLQKKNTNMYLCDVMKYPKPGHLELVFYGALSCWKLSLIAAHSAQSETNWIQFWIWTHFLNWCSVTKFFLLAIPLNAHTLTYFNSEMDDILINITFDCFSSRTLSRLLHGMDDPPLSVKKPKKGWDQFWIWINF